MKQNIIEHQIFDHTKWKKKILFQLLFKKRFRKRFFFSDFFFKEVMVNSPIPSRELGAYGCSDPILLENFFPRNGNLSPYEILAISTLVAHFKPKNLLEIGTFDGNTTLQMALNAPEDARIYTLDLPEGNAPTYCPVLKSDLRFIEDEKKQRRKFETSSVSHKVQQFLGDSTVFDFSKFTMNGLIDFAFIDGGHSEACVKSDTENVLKVLGENAVVLWHDFTPHFGGVYRFLCALSKTLPLVHVKDTHLVLYQKQGEKK